VGVSLDQISTAVAMLGNRLAGGDKSAVAALQALGLSMADIRNGSPDQAFLKIADALGQVEDWSTKSHLAVQLFGRSGLSLLPALNKEFAEAAANSAAMGKATAESLDKVEDSFSRMYRSGRVLLAEVLAPMAPALEKIASAASQVSRNVSEAPGFWEKLFALGGTNMGFGGTVALRQMVTQANATVGSRGQRIPMAVGEGASMGGFTPDHALDLLTSQVTQNVDGLRVLSGSTRRAAASLDRMATAADLLNRPGYFTEFLRGGQSSGAGGGFLATGTNLNNPWGGVGMLAPAGGSANFSPLTAPGFSYSSLGLAGLNTAMPFLSQLATGGSRGGQIGGSIAGGLGGAIGSMSSVVGALGSFAPFIGPIAGIVGSLIGKLFGPSQGAILGKEADARIGTTQAQLLQQFGSIENIRGTGAAGAALADAWGSKNVQGE